MKSITFVVPKAYAFFAENKNKRIGGAEIQSIYIAQELTKRNWNVNFLTSDFGQDKITKRKGITFYNVFNYSQLSIISFFKIFRFIFKHKKNTFVFRSASIQTAFIALISFYLFRSKVIYMIASDMEVEPELFKKQRSKLTFVLMNHLYKITNVLTVQSQYQMNKMRNSNPNIFILSNIIPEKNIENTEKKYISWVGKSLKMKKPELFLKLAQENPKEKFIMILAKNSDNDPYWLKLKEEATEIKNLTFLGQQEHTEVIKIYNKSKIYVITSEFEGFSNSMMEAMQAGCSILSYAVNPDQIIDRFELGLYSNKNIENLRKNLKTLILNKEITKKNGENSKKHIKQYHSTDSLPLELFDI